MHALFIARQTLCTVDNLVRARRISL